MHATAAHGWDAILMQARARVGLLQPLGRSGICAVRRCQHRPRWWWWCGVCVGGVGWGGVGWGGGRLAAGPSHPNERVVAAVMAQLNRRVHLLPAGLAWPGLAWPGLID
jgi:hypothetical protein